MFFVNADILIKFKCFCVFFISFNCSVYFLFTQLIFDRPNYNIGSNVEQLKTI